MIANEDMKIGNLAIKNRIIRSATYEGMADNNGYPTQEYKLLYKKLAEGGVGAIITGFCYISKDGRAMQPLQAGIDNDGKIECFKSIVDEVHKYNCRIFMQIAHAGRQTLSNATGTQIRGISKSKSYYFNEKPKVLTSDEINKIINNFGDSALRAKKAGFDGIQLHAAHGYLLHQSILPKINKRTDRFGINKGTNIGTKLFCAVIDNVRQKCGDDFPVIVKISGSDDYTPKFSNKQLVKLIKYLDSKSVSAIEISYGTMDYALNIFRGSNIPIDAILAHNPIFKAKTKFSYFLIKHVLLPILKLKILPFKPMYNLEYSKFAKRYTKIPIISVGGYRNYNEIDTVIKQNTADFVSLCRPLICEPDFVNKILHDKNYTSKCTNCNICAVMCDSMNSTRCYSASRRIK